MGNFFDFSLWDVLKHPTMQLLKKGTELGASAYMSERAKRENEELAAEEVREITKAAQAGDSNAQLALALRYAKHDVFDEFTYWLTQAINQGNEHALGVRDMLQGGK